MKGAVHMVLAPLILLFLAARSAEGRVATERRLRRARQFASSGSLRGASLAGRLTLTGDGDGKSDAGAAKKEEKGAEEETKPKDNEKKDEKEEKGKEATEKKDEGTEAKAKEKSAAKKDDAQRFEDDKKEDKAAKKDEGKKDDKKEDTKDDDKNTTAEDSKDKAGKNETEKNDAGRNSSSNVSNVSNFSTRELAHRDNFQDELVDQAGPEFDMASGGDDCINWSDVQRTARAQFEEDAPKYRGAGAAAIGADNVAAATGKNLDAIKAEFLQDLKALFEYADANADGCVNRSEFEASGRFEGPPRGYHDSRLESGTMAARELLAANATNISNLFRWLDRRVDGAISPDEFSVFGEGLLQDFTRDALFAFADADGSGDLSEKELLELYTKLKTDYNGFKILHEMKAGESYKRLDRAEFDFMDSNGDGRISESEAFHYANNHMTHADITPRLLRQIFKRADANYDGYVDFQEFEEAGSRFEGDGNETAARKMVPVAPPRFENASAANASSAKANTSSEGKKVEKKQPEKKAADKKQQFSPSITGGKSAPMPEEPKNQEPPSGPSSITGGKSEPLPDDVGDVAAPQAGSFALGRRPSLREALDAKSGFFARQLRK
eukprot:TRINITY_DN15381_c0_g1_i1.p2 TRINITY_DN15381_c0_g1~~TRINITY_DN15381_c0_g1_i1.p2  ORF type:complete len:611 (-),score=192.76 TRINITY_DN15381_c0_g1_i1:115-1947(-)